MACEKQHPKGNGLGRSEKEDSSFESMFKWPGDMKAANRRSNTTPLQSRLRSPRGSPNSGNSPRRRLFATDVGRFYARNVHWILMTILSTAFVLHWSLQNARSGGEPLDVPLPSSSSSSSSSKSNPAATATETDPSVRRAEVIGQKASYSKSKDNTNKSRSQNHDSIPNSRQSKNPLYNNVEKSHPVIPRTVYQPSTSRPLRAILVGRKEGPLLGPAASSQHYFPADLLLDGLDRSQYIKVIQWIEYDTVKQEISYIHKYHTNPSNEPLVIIVDWASLSRDCHALERIFNEMNYNTTTTNVNLSERTNVYLLYMDLSGSSKTVVCPSLEEEEQPHVPVGKDRTRIAKRGLVKGRYWNHDRGWVETGQLLDLNKEGTSVSGGPILHLPYFVREAFVDQLKNQTTKSLESLVELPSKKRKTDIAHFWRKRDYSHYGFLRRHVSSRIVSFGESIAEAKDRKLRWLVRTLGEGDDLEIHRVSEEYVSALISTKIVVVAQKDEWEDHYRLMEALASGALVMSDVMLAPPQGLLNETNILFYDSSASLCNLLDYYTDPGHKSERLSIARRGFEFAMGRHRSWHRMESILFGESLTLVDEMASAAPERKHPPKHAVTMTTATVL